MIERQKILEVLNESESRYPVHEWVVGDLHVWPLVRMVLANLMMDGSPEYGRRGESRMERVRRLIGHMNRTWLGYAKASFLDRKNNARISSPVDAVFLGDGVSFSRHRAEWYDRLCDPLIDILNDAGKTSCLLSRHNRFFHPRHNPSKWIQPQLDWIRLRAKLTGEKTPEGLTRLPEYDDYLKWINGQYPFVTPGRFQLEWSVFLIQKITALFLDWFAMLKPSVGVVAQFYDLDNFAFSLACRRSNIPCIEVQHGVQGPGHPMYARWLRHPAEGYELFPSVFWVWGETEYECLKEWTSQFPNCPVPVVGGNVYLAEWLSGKAEDVSHYDAAVSKIAESHPGKKHIILALQSRNQMDEAARNLLLPAIEKTRDSHLWWPRLHPTFLHDRDYYKNLFGNFSNMLDAGPVTELPLPAILRKADLMMTHHSTTIMEAEIFGVHSVVYGPESPSVFPEQIRSGIACFADSASDVVEMIDGQIRKRIPISELSAQSNKDLQVSREAFLNLADRRSNQ